jgi:hypothetical protein
MGRIENIKAFALRKEEENVAKENAALQRINNYKLQIIALKPRIDELIAVGNACLNNGIKIFHDSPTQSYENGYFCTNGWSHLLGFVRNYEDCKLKSITKLGIWGGGCCYFNLETDGITVDVSGIETEYVLKRFVNEFDEFESEFYKYVDNVTKK